MVDPSDPPRQTLIASMPGGLGYDEQGSLATYFALTFLSLAIVPSTVWSLRSAGPSCILRPLARSLTHSLTTFPSPLSRQTSKRSRPTPSRCQRSAAKRTRPGSLASPSPKLGASRASASSVSLLLPLPLRGIARPIRLAKELTLVLSLRRTLLLLVGWVLFAGLAYKAATSEVVQTAVYNPFEILGISEVRSRPPAPAGLEPRPGLDRGPLADAPGSFDFGRLVAD